MATQHELRQYLGTLSAILWNFGATFPAPTLDEFTTGELGFSFTAVLPGPAIPGSAVIRMAEIWTPGRPGHFDRREYEYDFIDYPLGRRRAFHGHDPDHFAREFGVLVHEHCEERLGSPDCDHYYGLPVDGYRAIEQFTALWGQPAPLGCAGLRCMASQPRGAAPPRPLGNHAPSILTSRPTNTH